MNLIWNLIARVLAKPRTVERLIARAKRTPYTHIRGPNGSVYMERYWLFNPYPPESSGKRPWWKFPISIRLHRIMRPDGDRHLHDHPWNARTIILRGGYNEVRREVEPGRGTSWIDGDYVDEVEYYRRAGDTATLKFGEFHRIIWVSDGGVWTLFITGKYRGTWGFNVDGIKVQWRKYLGLDGGAS